MTNPPSARSDAQIRDEALAWIFPWWARRSPRLRELCKRVWATDWWVKRQRRKGLL